MIEHLVADIARDRPGALFLVSPREAVSYADLYTTLISVREGLRQHPGSNFACYLPDTAELIVLLLAAACTPKTMLVLNKDFTPHALSEYVERFDIDTLFCESRSEIGCGCEEIPIGAWLNGLSRLSINPTDSGPAETPGHLRILTSGTTGEPRCARYQWSDLLAQIKPYEALSDERWLLAYHLNHFAGIQMLAHALVTGATLILPETTSVAGNVRAMIEHRATHVSASPTFWRFALTQMHEEQDLAGIVQITLGSEAVSQQLLDTLQERLPQARIVHIYASTEDGSCVSVADGRAGLPAAILFRDGEQQTRFRIDDGELFVQSVHGMLGYEDNENDGFVAAKTGSSWRATGDLVEVTGDRIHFLGRRSEVINVGGVKVYPLEVEAVISGVPGVQLVRAYGQDNPVVGQIVATDIILDQGADKNTVEALVREACGALPRHSMPRNINFVATIDMANLKLSRR